MILQRNFDFYRTFEILKAGLFYPFTDLFCPIQTAERGGFEPPKPFRGLHAFQACQFNHSCIFPLITRYKDRIKSRNRKVKNKNSFHLFMALSLELIEYKNQTLFYSEKFVILYTTMPKYRFVFHFHRYFFKSEMSYFTLPLSIERDISIFFH